MVGFWDWGSDMRLPVIHGVIKRRLLVNFRVDADVMSRMLPKGFSPKLHEGYAIAGICLIRLERIRPRWVPGFMGIASENAAHRVAVTWVNQRGQACEGVYIPRRDTQSRWTHWAGGRLFPGEHHLAAFNVTDKDGRVEMNIAAQDGGMRIGLSARETTALPTASCFKSLGESSCFFEGGSVGYSVTHDCHRLDGVRLAVERWQVKALEVERVESSFFNNCAAFPEGSVVFDHALIMRDVVHSWHGEPDMVTG